ncbi:MAG: cyclic nucleotide-binding domain-containing protein, partial [Desulfotomaculales bacterium]
QGRVVGAGGPGGPVVLSAGDVFGEEGMARGFRRFATARAAEESLLLVITEDNFLRLVRLKPELILQAVKKMGERIAR